MPAAYAHLIFGRRVFDALPAGGVKDTITRHRALFEIGLQGPDILFFFHPLTHTALRQIGYDMHEENPLPFLERPVCRAASGGALAYLLGFICHYTLDSECHTSVEYFMEKIGRGHSEIETDFERFLMLRDHADPYHTSPVSYVVNSRDNASVIAPFYDTQPRKIHEALTTMKLVFKLLMSSSEVKYAVLKKVGRWMGEGSAVTQLTMDRTADPVYTLSNQVLSQELEQAVPVAVALMESFSSWQRHETSLSPRFQQTFSFDPRALASRKERDQDV